MSHFEGDAERAARGFRVALELDHLQQMDMIRVLGEMKRRGVIKGWVVVPDREMPRAEGKFDPATRFISISETTYAGAKRGIPAANFSIAHELGHVAHRVTEMRLRDRDAIRGSRTAQDESFADRFAATFLAPFHRSNFGPTTTVDQIRQRFNLDEATAIARHEEFSSQFRKINQIERPLPATVISFLEEARTRAKQTESSSRMAEARSSEVNLLPVSAFGLSEVATGEYCGVCCSRRLQLAGSTRAYCPDCGATYNRFQDGDPAA